MDVITTGDPVAETVPTQPRLDRPVLVGNVVSGALWLLALALLGSWPLSLIGAVYVVAGSVFLAAVYARDALTMRQEAMAWAAPWLVAVAMWWAILVQFGGEPLGSYVVLGAPLHALLIATPCFLAWQLVALAVRQLMAWKALSVRR